MKKSAVRVQRGEKMVGALRKTTDAPSSHDDASRRGRGCASMGHQRPASGKGHSGVDRHVQGEDGSPSTHAAERTGLRDDPLAAERVPGNRAGGAPDDHVRDYAGAVRAVPATRKRHPGEGQGGRPKRRRAVALSRQAGREPPGDAQGEDTHVWEPKVSLCGRERSADRPANRVARPTRAANCSSQGTLHTKNDGGLNARCGGADGGQRRGAGGGVRFRGVKVMSAAVKAALRKLIERLPARVRPPVVAKSRSLRHRMALSHIKRFSP